MRALSLSCLLGCPWVANLGGSVWPQALAAPMTTRNRPGCWCWCYPLAHAAPTLLLSLPASGDGPLSVPWHPGHPVTPPTSWGDPFLPGRLFGGEPSSLHPAPRPLHKLVPQAKAALLPQSGPRGPASRPGAEPGVQRSPTPSQEPTLGLVAGQVWLLCGCRAGQPAQCPLQLRHVHAGRELPVAVPNLSPGRARSAGRLLRGPPWAPRDRASLCPKGGVWCLPRVGAVSCTPGHPPHTAGRLGAPGSQVSGSVGPSVWGWAVNLPAREASCPPLRLRLGAEAHRADQS